MIPAEILEIAACPRCKARVVPDSQDMRLCCESCRLSFPVRDGFPILLVEEALPVLSVTGSSSRSTPSGL